MSKRLEQSRLGIVVNADASVADFKLDHSFGVGLVNEGHVDEHLAFFGKFDGVGHEVHQDLTQPAWIAAQPTGHFIMNQRRQFQAFGAGALGEQFECVFNHFRYAELFRFKSQLAGFNPGEVEDVIDNGEQGLGAAANGFGKVALFGSEVGVQ